MSNEMLETSAVLAVLIEAAALAFALLRRDLTAVVVLNLLAAAGLLVALVPDLAASAKTLAEGFLIFEIAVLVLALVTLATSLFWLAYRKLAWLVWIEFSGHALLALAFLLFAFTFRITRLI
jgi:hypothetical protein